jgi:hypothetical protein
VPITENIIDLDHAMSTNDSMKEGLKIVTNADTILFDYSLMKKMMKSPKMM